MFRLDRDSEIKGGQYEGNLQSFIDGFGNTDFNSAYWFGLKAMKKITDEATVDFNVHYTEGTTTRQDTFLNFTILDDEYRIAYTSHWGHENGGTIIGVISFALTASILMKLLIRRNPEIKS